MDAFINLGTEVFKNKASDSILERQIRNALQEFLDTQTGLNEICSKEEEIDFEGLSIYMTEQMIVDIEDRIFGTNPRLRGEARKNIVNKALYYSNANTRLSQERATKIVLKSLDILRDFYLRGCPKDIRYALTAVVDDVEEVVLISEERISEKMQTSTQEIVDTIRSSFPLPIETGLKLLSNGKISQVDNILNDYINSMSSKHILYPAYGFAAKSYGMQNFLMSIPLTKDAEQEHPPHFVCEGTATIEGKVAGLPTLDLFEHAKRHQKPIRLGVESATKYLGDVKDPQQFEAESLVGQDFVIPPAPFPEALPCSIVIDNYVALNYIMLRTKEILDDDTIIMTNQEQSGSNIYFSIAISVEKRRVDFTIQVRGKKLIDVIQYRQLLRMIISGESVGVRLLSDGKFLFQGKFDNENKLSDLEKLNTELLLLEKIDKIQKYFGVDMDFPDEIKQSESSKLDYAYSIISGQEVRRNWSDMSLVMPVSEKTKQIINDIGTQEISIRYSFIETISFFDREFELPCRRVVSPLVLADLTKLKQKLEVLDEDDSIKLIFVPGKSQQDSVIIDTLDSPEIPIVTNLD